MVLLAVCSPAPGLHPAPVPCSPDVPAAPLHPGPVSARGGAHRVPPTLGQGRLAGEGSGWREGITPVEEENRGILLQISLPHIYHIIALTSHTNPPMV